MSRSSGHSAEIQLRSGPGNLARSSTAQDGLAPLTALSQNHVGVLVTMCVCVCVCVCTCTLEIKCSRRAQASMDGSSEVRPRLVQAEGWASQRVLSVSFAYSLLLLPLFSLLSHHFPHLLFLSHLLSLSFSPPLPLSLSLHHFQPVSLTVSTPASLPPSLPPSLPLPVNR